MHSCILAAASDADWAIITDLVVILVSAALVAVAVQPMRLAAILAYLIAGAVIGPRARLGRQVYIDRQLCHVGVLLPPERCARLNNGSRVASLSCGAMTHGKQTLREQASLRRP